MLFLECEQHDAWVRKCKLLRRLSEWKMSHLCFVFFFKPDGWQSYVNHGWSNEMWWSFYERTKQKCQSCIRRGVIWEYLNKDVCYINGALAQHCDRVCWHLPPPASGKPHNHTETLTSACDRSDHSSGFQFLPAD